MLRVRKKSPIYEAFQLPKTLDEVPPEIIQFIKDREELRFLSEDKRQEICPEAEYTLVWETEEFPAVLAVPTSWLLMRNDKLDVYPDDEFRTVFEPCDPSVLDLSQLTDVGPIDEDEDDKT